MAIMFLVGTLCVKEIEPNERTKFGVLFSQDIL
jgi:hypothetical protein